MPQGPPTIIRGRRTLGNNGPRTVRRWQEAASQRSAAGSWRLVCACVRLCGRPGRLSRGRERLGEGRGAESEAVLLGQCRWADLRRGSLEATACQPERSARLATGDEMCCSEGKLLQPHPQQS